MTAGMGEHTSRDFEAELTAIRAKLQDMARRVDQIVESSGRALLNHDVALANQVILSDDETDDMEMDVDHLCLQVLARRQPVAGDLRLLTSVLKLVVDLERVGDLGVSIATRVLDLEDEPPPLPYDELILMLNTARQMVAEAMTALLTGDVERAQGVIRRDTAVDAANMRFLNEVVSGARAGTVDLANAVHVQAVSKYIEGIADHAVSIAERAVFILTGEEVRHLPPGRRTGVS